MATLTMGDVVTLTMSAAAKGFRPVLLLNVHAQPIELRSLLQPH